MAENSTYDFVVNDEDEVLLLLYASETQPDNAKIILHPEDDSAELFRNAEEVVLLESIPAEIFDSLEDADKLMVCELSNTEDENESQIVFAYEAEVLN